MRTPLPGFTNIVHLTDFYGIPAVVRQGRPMARHLGIDRQRETEILRRIRHLDIGPELLHADTERDQATFRAIPGTSLDPSSTDRSTLSQTLGVLSVLHRQPASGRPFSAASMIRHYLSMSAVSPDFTEFCLRQAEISERLENKVPLGLCHNDCVAKNWILQPDQKVKLIDFEFAGPNDPAFDLATWCLTFSIDPGDALLSEYEQWDQKLTRRICDYLPVVDTLWALFCILMAPELAGVDRDMALVQLQSRMERLQLDGLPADRAYEAVKQ